MSPNEPVVGFSVASEETCLLRGNVRAAGVAVFFTAMLKLFKAEIVCVLILGLSA